MIVFFNGHFIPKEDVKISPDDRGFLFADGIYEVIRSYNGRLFKAEEHFERMNRSLRELRMNKPDTENFIDIAHQLIQYNHLEDTDAILYFQVTRGVAQRNHAFPDINTCPTFYASASAFEPPEEKLKNGVKAILVPDIRWSRCDIKSVSLLPNVLARQQAKERGAEEAVFVRDGILTEGSRSNFCAILNGQLVTHPKNNHILAGVTRETILKLCETCHIPFREFPIYERELKAAAELMIVGTTVEVMPVIEVDNWKVGNGKPGSLTLKIQRAFFEMTR
jgi:D-alanine transaminase